MAKVLIPSINVGDQITNADLNSFGSSLAATSTALNNDNVRTQGIDRRNLASDAVYGTGVTTSLYYGSANVDFTIPLTLAAISHPTTANTWIAVGMNGVALGDNPITLSHGDKVIVYCSFEYHVNVNATYSLFAPTVKGCYQVDFAIHRSINGGAFSSVSGTQRSSNLVGVGMNVLPDASARHYIPRASMTIVTVYENTSGSDVEYRAALFGSAHRSLDPATLIEAVVTQAQMFAKIVRR